MSDYSFINEYRGQRMSRIAYIDDMSKWEKEFQFSHNVTVRFSETDMFGHLNNTVPFTYFELARIEYFKFLGFMNDWVNPDIESIPVVADLQCDFVKQVYYDESIDLYVKAVKIGNSSVDLHYMGKKVNGEIVFTGRGTIVQISRITGKAIAWTEGKKNKFISTSKNHAIC
nr:MULTISPECIES: thioesterase family protein [Bacillus]